MLAIKEYFKRPEQAAASLLLRYGRWIPDKVYLRIMFRLMVGYKLDLKCPKTYNQKLQWLKLYDRRPEYSTMVDKYAAKEYVAKIIGEKYIIPTIGVWDNPEDIDWEVLPNQFVLKTTHGGGNSGVVICKDKQSFDKKKAIAKLKNSLKQDVYSVAREWPYKNVRRRVLAEIYLDPSCCNTNGGGYFDGNQDLADWKFFCFNGEVKAFFIGTERSSGDVKFDYFDADFNHLDLVQEHPMSGKSFIKPLHFEEMKMIASKLSKGIPQVRVDLYNVNGKIYFGELTFFHHGGVTPFHPIEWDYTFGKWIKLPQKQK